MIDARNATPAETLEQRIMDPCVAKSEAEWWAHREIAKQRAEIERQRAENERLRAALEQFRCSCDPGECVEYGERWSSACEKGEARKALEGKP